jgi:hypothetical protein
MPRSGACKTFCAKIPDTGIQPLSEVRCGSSPFGCHEARRSPFQNALCVRKSSSKARRSPFQNALFVRKSSSNSLKIPHIRPYEEPYEPAELPEAPLANEKHTVHAKYVCAHQSEKLANENILCTQSMFVRIKARSSQMKTYCARKVCLCASTREARECKHTVHAKYVCAHQGEKLANENILCTQSMCAHQGEKLANENILCTQSMFVRIKARSSRMKTYCARKVCLCASRQEARK